MQPKSEAARKRFEFTDKELSKAHMDVQILHNIERQLDGIADRVEAGTDQLLALIEELKPKKRTTKKKA